MTNKSVKIKIAFAPGCFDDFEGSQEELDKFVEEIKKMAESGELFDNAVRYEDLDDYDVDDYFDDDHFFDHTSKRLH